MNGRAIESTKEISKRGSRRARAVVISFFRFLVDLFLFLATTVAFYLLVLRQALAAAPEMMW
jgi:hypothetical protein